MRSHYEGLYEASEPARKQYHCNLRNSLGTMQRHDVQSKLESLDAFKAQSKVCDCIWLMKVIQAIRHRFEGTRNVYISLDDVWSAHYSQKQGAQQPLWEYLKEFQNSVQVLEHYGAVIGADGPNTIRSHL